MKIYFHLKVAKVKRARVMKYKRRMPLYRGIHAFLGKIKHDIITIRNTLHVKTSGPDSAYSLEASSFTYLKDQYAALRATNEFIHSCETYAYMRVKGYTIDYISAYSGQVISTTPQYSYILPELYVDMTGDVYTGTSGFTSVSIVNSDTCVRYQPNNTMKKASPVYFRFPRVLSGGGDKSIAGYDNWIPTNTFASDSSFAMYLLIGFSGFTYPALSTDGSFPVGKIEMKWYIDFAKKIPMEKGPLTP